MATTITAQDEQFVLEIVARDGQVYRADLATWQQRAAERLVKRGRLQRRDEYGEYAHWGDGPTRFVVYYDPHRQAPDYTGPRLVK